MKMDQIRQQNAMYGDNDDPNVQKMNNQLQNLDLQEGEMPEENESYNTSDEESEDYDSEESSEFEDEGSDKEVDIQYLNRYQQKMR